MSTDKDNQLRREHAAEPAAEAWWVYVVRCADRSLYTGIARDFASRVGEHNAGLGAKYTRSRLPVTLVYTEPSGSRSSAQRRELEIKRMSRREKLSLIEGSGPQRTASGRNGEPVAPAKRIGVAMNRNS